jgi:putative ABC transport system permease protein
VIDTLRELGQGLRSLRRAPGTAALAVGTLALGMALVTVQYTPVHRLLLAPLPIDGSGRLVSVRWSRPAPHSRGARLHHQELRALAGVQGSFAQLTGFNLDEIGHSLRLADGRWLQRTGLAVLPGLLEAAGIQIALGRAFTAEDHRPGAPPVLVISHGLWTELGGGRDILGKSIYFDRQQRTIVGVARGGVAVDREGFWAPAPEPARDADRDETPPLQVLALLQPGITLGHAQADVGRLGAGISNLAPALLAELGALEVVPVRQALVRPEVIEFYRLMLGAVLLVLLAACANAANLLLARAAGRRHELAVRVSLGATRGRLVRQLLGEGLVIGLGAAALGLAASAALARLAARQTELMPLPAWVSFRLDGPVAAAVTAIAVAATVLSALVPALRASRLALPSVLGSDARASAGLAATRASSTFLVVQIAVSAGVLLVALAAGLTARERARRALHVDPQRFVTTGLVFPRDEFPSDDRVRALTQALDQRLRTLDGGLRGAVSTRRGLGRGEQVQVQIGGETGGPGRPAFQAAVGLSYFQVLSAPVLEGRGFDDGDRRGSARVAVVDLNFVRAFWPGQAAVGRNFQVLGRRGPPQRLLVVGVVPSLHLGGAGEDASEAPGFYVPLAQLDRRAALFPLATGPGGKPALGAALIRTIRAVDPERPPRRLWTFGELLDDQQAGLRLFSGLFSLFGLATLVLSAVGLYGLVALAVRQRVREIGTRVALGATGGRILTLFLSRAARQLALGLAFGAALGTILIAVFERRLGPLGATAEAHALVAVALSFAAFAATILPAARAARLPPTVALRQP